MKAGIMSVFSGKLAYSQKILRDISKLLRNPRESTYHPAAPHKSKWSISKDILLWLAKNKEVNRYYYVYGLDLLNNKREQEVLPYTTFRKLRDTENLRPRGLNFNYACMLRDKFVFGQLLTSLKFPTPRNIAFLDRNQVTWLDTMQSEPLEGIQRRQAPIDGFCKLLTGIQGQGAFPLQIADGRITSGENELAPQQLKEMINGQYLLQERISQHADLARLHPSSINTIRMITFNNNGRIEVFCATLRIGAKRRNVDNWASGGIVVAVDLESGKLRDEGLFKPGYGGKVEVHPDTNIRFSGYQLPFFEESKELACRLHQYFYGVHSIGWDIAITPAGPVFIEGNEDWDGSIPMSLERNFRERFLRMFRKRGWRDEVKD